MNHLLTLPALLGVVVLVAIGTAAPARADDALKGVLEEVARRRIYFGHQSVGLNLLEGLRELAAQEGVPLRIADAQAAGVQAGTLAHAPVAENGDPLRKLRSFEQAFSTGQAAGADIALVKFCYVDVRATTDVAALFDAYRRSLAKLQAAHPETTFLHVTLPLQRVEQGVRGFAKRVLGRTLWGTDHNARREEFNDLLRNAYAGKEPLFDLARAEATRPDGTTETSAWNGRPVRALVPEYTDDGGHLNRTGRMRAARELAAAIAAIPRRDAEAASAR